MFFMIKTINHLMSFWFYLDLNALTWNSKLKLFLLLLLCMYCECLIWSCPLPSSTVSLHILYSGLSPVPTFSHPPSLVWRLKQHFFTHKNRQSKFHLPTLKRLFFRNHNLAIFSLSFHFYCHSWHDKMSMCLLPFLHHLPSIPTCYNLPTQFLHPTVSTQTGSDF